MSLSTASVESSALTPGNNSVNRYRIASYSLAAGGSLLAAFLAYSHPSISMLVAAILCGWAEVDGLCGSSHVGALTPLRALEKTGRLWARCCFAYTLGGMVSASVVGLSAGLIGQALNLSGPWTDYAFGLLSIAALVLALRELGIPSFFSLPQIHRQTEKMWALNFGFETGAAMWGTHIGLGFATVIRHGGLYAFAILALLLHPAHGALVMASFWVGRTLPIWATPLFTGDEKDGDAVTDLLFAHPGQYRLCAFAGLLILAVIAALLGSVNGSQALG